MIATAEREYGQLNILFNNAGIMHSQDDDAVSTDEAVWDVTMNVNAKGVFFGCKYGIPALRRAGGGAIVNTASFVAVVGAATPLGIRSSVVIAIDILRPLVQPAPKRARAPREDTVSGGWVAVQYRSR